MGGVNHERPWIDTTQGVCDHGNYENSSFAKLDDLDDHTSMMDKIHHESQQNSGTKTCSVVGFPHISQVWVIEHCATWFLFNKVKAPKNWNAYSKPLHLKHIFQKTADLPGNLPFKSNFGGWTDETDRNAWMPWPPWISGLRTWAPKSPKRWRNWWHKNRAPNTGAVPVWCLLQQMVDVLLQVNLSGCKWTFLKISDLLEDGKLIIG